MNLSIKSVNKSFGNRRVLKDFSCDFEEVGLYVLAGESGSGKTTLMRLISGLDNNYSGEIIGGGTKSTSFLFQEKRLFPTLSALENVLLLSFSAYSDLDLSRTKAGFEMLGFSESDMALMPSELSGGMQQRVSFLRAVMRDAPILLLDEPTKELDEKNRLIINDMIKEEATRRLVIISTHNAADIAYLSPTVINLSDI